MKRNTFEKPTTALGVQGAALAVEGLFMAGCPDGKLVRKILILNYWN